MDSRASAVAAVFFIIVFSNGFAVTRSLIDTAHSLQIRPLIGGVYDPRGDRLFGYIAPIMIAFATGLSTAVILRIPILRYGWRYAAFAAFKAVSITAILPMLWIEGGRRSVHGLHTRRLGSWPAVSVWERSSSCCLQWG